MSNLEEKLLDEKEKLERNIVRLEGERDMWERRFQMLAFTIEVVEGKEVAKLRIKTIKEHVK